MTFYKKLVAVSLAVTVLPTVAYAQRLFPHPRDREFHDVAEVTINRYYQGQGTINLDYELDLNRRHRGKIIRDVIILANVIDHGRGYGRAEARLLSDGRPLGYPVMIHSSRFSQEYSLGQPSRDWHNLTIELSLNQRRRWPRRQPDILVEKLIVRFDRRFEPGPNPIPDERDTIMQRVNLNVRGQDRLDLNRILNLDPRQTRRENSSRWRGG